MWRKKAAERCSKTGFEDVGRALLLFSRSVMSISGPMDRSMPGSLPFTGAHSVLRFMSTQSEEGIRS